jgi:hypothetical protein
MHSASNTRSPEATDRRIDKNALRKKWPADTTDKMAEKSDQGEHFSSFPVSLSLD